MLEKVILWPGDVPEDSVGPLASIYADLVEGEPDAPSPALFQQLFSSLVEPLSENEKRNCLLSIVNADGMVGFATGSLLQATAELDYLWVAKTYRRSGQATLLLELFENLVRSKGAERVILEVSERNFGAKKLYTKNGYIELSLRKRYYKDGSDAHVMEKRLER